MCSRSGANVKVKSRSGNNRPTSFLSPSLSIILLFMGVCFIGFAADPDHSSGAPKADAKSGAPAAKDATVHADKTGDAERAKVDTPDPNSPKEEKAEFKGKVNPLLKIESKYTEICVHTACDNEATTFFKEEVEKQSITPVKFTSPADLKSCVQKTPSGTKRLIIAAKGDPKKLASFEKEEYEEVRKVVKEHGIEEVSFAACSAGDKSQYEGFEEVREVFKKEQGIKTNCGYMCLKPGVQPTVEEREDLEIRRERRSGGEDGAPFEPPPRVGYQPRPHPIMPPQVEEFTEEEGRHEKKEFHESDPIPEPIGPPPPKKAHGGVPFIPPKKAHGGGSGQGAVGAAPPPHSGGGAVEAGGSGGGSPGGFRMGAGGGSQRRPMPMMGPQPMPMVPLAPPSGKVEVTEGEEFKLPDCDDCGRRRDKKEPKPILPLPMQKPGFGFGFGIGIGVGVNPNPFMQQGYPALNGRVAPYGSMSPWLQQPGRYPGDSVANPYPTGNGLTPGVAPYNSYGSIANPSSSIPYGGAPYSPAPNVNRITPPGSTPLN